MGENLWHTVSNIFLQKGKGFYASGYQGSFGNLRGLFFWDEALEVAVGQSEIPQWLTADYICKIDKDYQFLGDMQDLVISALE